MSILAGTCATPRWLYDLRASVSFDLCSQWINMLSQGMSAMQHNSSGGEQLWMQPCLPIYKMSGESIETQMSE